MALRPPLYDVHKELGAKFTEFSGFEMPVSYASMLEEHRAVREGVGLFDVSHMSNLWVKGPDATRLISKVVTTNPAKVEDGRASYTSYTKEDGTVLDDTIYYRLNERLYHVVPNAGMNELVVGHIKKHFSGNVLVEDVSRSTCIFALQGPAAEGVLQPLTTADVEGMAAMRAVETTVAGVRCLLTSSGYTGERGFEFMVPNEGAEKLYRALLEAGEDEGIMPIGLGARDTLRMEMGYCLAGHEFAGGRTPLEAGLGWTVHWDHDFVGRPALEKQKEMGVKQRLVGLLLEERGIPRQHCAIEASSGEKVGVVTSGTLSPTLGKGIALGYVAAAHAKAGTALAIRIRDKPVKAIVSKPPFLKREGS